MNEIYPNNFAVDTASTDLYFVSVIVPAYNSPKRTAKCIQALLNQSYPKNSYEIILIDNGSSDDTVKTIQEYPVIFLSEKTIKSPYAARNKGIKNAKGDIIAMIDINCTPNRHWIHAGVETIATKVQIWSEEILFSPFHPIKQILRYSIQLRMYKLNTTFERGRSQKGVIYL